MAHDSASDLGLGVGVTLAVVAVAAAVWLAVTDPNATLGPASGVNASAVPFAVAMVAGVAAVAGVHLLGDG